MFIPNPGSLGTAVSLIRIRKKEFKYFDPTIFYQALGNMIWDVYPGSRILISFHWISDLGSGGSTRMRNAAFYSLFVFERYFSPFMRI
jgi:hypothetical protein